MKKFNIAEEYTITPGPRLVRHGKYSGEDFRNRVLYNLVEECINSNEKLEINLDGTYGYPSSFLEESFGGLIRAGLKKEKVLDVLSFVSTDQEELPDKIINYIKDAKEK